MRTKILGIAAIVGAVLSLSALVSSHLLRPKIGIVSEDIVTFASGDMAWLVTASLAVLNEWQNHPSLAELDAPASK